MRFQTEERGIVVLCQVTRTQKIADSARFGGFESCCSPYGTALKKAEASLAKASTAKTSTQTRPTAATDAVAAYGSMADYVLVKQAADRVDFTDWDKKTTTQQRTALKRSGLSEEAQWTLLNKDGSYLETLSVISDLRDNRMDYGLSAAETEQIGGELLTIAAARANATGNEQPYLSTIPRAQMVKYLDEKKTALLQSIGYLESDTVGGDTSLWYDGEEDGPMLGPSPTLPQVTPNPQEIVIQENVATLESLANNVDVNMRQLAEINDAIKQIKSGALTESQQKQLVESTQIVVSKLEDIKSAPNPKWRENNAEYAESLGLKLMDYRYHDGQYWLKIKYGQQRKEMPLGEEVPRNVIVWAKKATGDDVKRRQLGQYLEIVTRLEHVLDFILFTSKGIDFSVSYIPGVNKIVEELDYWKNASHITEDTVSVFAWIYAPNRYGKTTRNTEQIRFDDFIGVG